MSLSLFIKLLALVVVAVVHATKHVETIRIKPNDPGSWTPMDVNVRVWIPFGGNLNLSLHSGNWKAGHGVQYRFVLNNENYDPIFDRLGADTWASGVECRYNTSVDDQPPTYRGCWSSLSDDLKRSDAPNARWKEGAEIIAVTHMDVTITGDTGGANKPKVDVLLLVRDHSPAETRSWQTNAMAIDLDHPDESVPLGVAAAVRFAKGFVNYMSRIPLLGLLFENYAWYIVNDVTTIKNNGVDQGNIQAYVNEGNEAEADPVFWDTEIHELRVTITGPFVEIMADWSIYNPHYSPGNPFRTIRSKQKIEMQLSPYGLIQTARQFVNALFFYLGRVFEGTTTVNTDTLCDKIQRVCNNTVLQTFYPTPAEINMTCPFPLASDPTKCSAQQYTDKAQCVAQVSALDQGFPLSGTGATEFCVQFHTDVAGASALGADRHCLHASRYKFPLGLPNDVHTPCNVYP